MYGDTDLQQYKLEAQLSLLQEVVQAMGCDTSRFDIADLLDFFSHSEMLAKSYWVRFAPVVSLCLSCQLPMSSASAPSPPWKRVKTYLRSTTGDGRLNHFMLLHVHKELADGIDMPEVANLFVGDKQRRKQLFGMFSKDDLPSKSTFASEANQTV